MQPKKTSNKSPLEFFLTAKAWQLFAICTIPAILVFVLLPQGAYTPIIIVLAVTFAAFPWLLWLHSVGSSLGRITQSTLAPHFAFFSFSIIYCLMYLLAFAFLLADLFRNGSFGEEYTLVLGLLIPAQLYAGFSIYYTVYYVAQRLTIIEVQRKPVFAEVIQNFVLLFFFPIGVWITQPKIRSIFNQLKT